MATVGAFAAKTHFSELLDRVERGERILIQRRGKTVAELTPPTGQQKRPWRDILAEIKEIRRHNRVPKGFILSAIHEGRRFE